MQSKGSACVWRTNHAPSWWRQEAAKGQAGSQWKMVGEGREISVKDSAFVPLSGQAMQQLDLGSASSRHEQPLSLIQARTLLSCMQGLPTHPAELPEEDYGSAYFMHGCSGPFSHGFHRCCMVWWHLTQQPREPESSL